VDEVSRTQSIKKGREGRRSECSVPIGHEPSRRELLQREDDSRRMLRLERG
jgi:hypothetical protein